MRGLTYLGPGKLEWQERPRPRLESVAGAVVRPLAVATCDLDAMIVAGESPFPAPFVLGHEGVGEVVEVGDAVRLFKPGDRVLVPFQISCGSCESCVAGRTGNCLTVPLAQTYGFGFGAAATRWGGFLADAIGVPYADAMLMAVPDQVPSALAASASDNLTDAYRAVGPWLAQRPGAPVLVTGGAASGSIGLFAVALAAALGSEEVVYIDEDEGRRAVAARFGATVLDQVPDRLDHRYPIAVNAAGSAAALALCLSSLDRDGICTSTSIAFDPETVPVFPLLSMYVMSTTFVTGRIHARHHAPAVLELLADEALDVGPIVTAEVPFDAAAEALLEPHTKLIMVPDGAGAAPAAVQGR